MADVSTFAVRERMGAQQLGLLDQRALPEETRWWWLGDHPEAAEAADATTLGATVAEAAAAIECLAVRGAPAIGGAAALALAYGAEEQAAVVTTTPTLRQWWAAADARLRRTRPTAVNLFVALDAARDAVAAVADDAPIAAIPSALRAAATRYVDNDRAACLAMGDAGAALLNDGDVVITICHTGALATCGQGTALGVVKSARRAGKDIAVVALETRPLLQGARLTSWECLVEDIPLTLITDGMAAFAMSPRGLPSLEGRRIRRAFVGADRVAHNGDTANKIGTYALALACQAHGVPFHVVAPRSTFDLACVDGAAIPIEERHADEVRHARGRQTAPQNAPVWNPAFDVTPAALIASWITERGEERAPFLR